VKTSNLTSASVNRKFMRSTNIFRFAKVLHQETYSNIFFKQKHILINEKKYRKSVLAISPSLFTTPQLSVRLSEPADP
jgi:hypothetical protein